MLKHNRNIDAFSVLEVSLVLGLMGLLCSLFFGAINRYQFVLRDEVNIKQELNGFFQFRSNFWRELDEADSIQVITSSRNILNIYSDKEIITYQEDPTKQFIERRKGEDVNEFAYKLVSLEENNNSIQLALEWKGETFQIRYPIQLSDAKRINQYFNLKTWK